MKKIWIIIITGILLRVFLSFASFHPDIQALSDGGKFIAGGNLFDLYEYTSDRLVLNYPPLIYWYFGLFDLLFNNNLAFLKLSYLLFDLPIAFLLLKMVDVKKAGLVLSLWMFNPVNLYSTYMMGQFDIIPIFFSVLSIYFALKNKLVLAALSLGGGIAFKIYPVFLLIPLIVIPRSWLIKFKLIAIAMLPYFLSILPYIFSINFRTYALFANQSSKSLYASIPVSGGESVFLFPAVLVFFYLYIWIKRFENNSLWEIYLIPLLLFFMFTHYHPQWLNWVTPFLVLGLVSQKNKIIFPVLTIFLSWVGSLFFFDSSLTLGIFSPLFPQLRDLPDLWTLFQLNVDVNYSRSLLQTIFVSSAAFIIYRFFPRTDNG